MAYTPINWQTGDTITAEKMNKMDNGWSATVTTSTLFDGSCTTESEGGAPYCEIDFFDDAPDTFVITFNNTEYTCQKNENDAWGMIFYGDYDFNNDEPVFTTYPFTIITYSDPGSSGLLLLTETAGTYAIKLVAKNVAYETSEEFDGVTRKIATEAAENAKDYRYETETIDVFGGAVETSTSSQNAYYAEISLSQSIAGAFEITVTFPSPVGEVTVPNIGLCWFGAPYNPLANTWDWSEYTFAVDCNTFTGVTKFWTQTEQSYADLVISAKFSVMVADDEFTDAVLASRPSGSFTSPKYAVDFAEYRNSAAQSISANTTTPLRCTSSYGLVTDADKVIFGGATLLPSGLVIGQMQYSQSSKEIELTVTNLTDAQIDVAKEGIRFNVIGLKLYTVTTHYYLAGKSS